MKGYKVLLTVLLLIFALCVGYVVTDCIRLRLSETGTKPLITLAETVTENRTTYTGIGYTVQYYTDTLENGGNVIEVRGYGAEFRLFGNLIWAWVE